MFEMYDCFILTKKIPGAEDEIPVGYVGVVLMVYSHDPPTYEVEFVDKDGGNLGKEGTYTITEDYMKPWKEGMKDITM